MRQRIFWLMGLFLALCAISSSTQDELEISKDLTRSASDEEWKIVNTKDSRQEGMIPKRETHWTRREIDADKIGCWRYCVERRISEGETGNNESTKRVNIIWNIVEEARVTLSGKTSSFWGRFSGQDKDLRWESSTISSDKSQIFHDDDPKCELYLELGCKSFDKLNSSISTIPDKFSHSDQQKLVTMNDAIGFSSTVFSVNKVTEKLRILAFGRLSQAVLEIPIAQRESDFADARRTRPTFSLSRTSDAKGIVIDARNPPSGEWRLNLLGMENSNYSFSVTTIPSRRIIENLNVRNDSITAKSLTGEVTLNNEQEELDMKPSEMLSRSQRVAYPRTRNDNNSARAIKSDDQQLVNRENLTNLTEILESHVPKEPSARALISETNEMKLSRSANLEAELMETESEGKMDDEDIGENARILQVSEVDEFSRITEETRPYRRTVVDLDPRTELVVRPGNFQDIVFTVTNNQAFDMRHTFQGSSKPFAYIGVIPEAFWMRAGETINVAVRIQVPDVEYAEPNMVTLYVRGNENYEVVEKSTYVYVQGSRGTITTDSSKPNIDYWFNDNCAGKLHRDRCYRSRWSVEITIDDPDSGLKRVTSLPSGVEPRTEFISGTKNRVSFYYSSTCCHTTVDITASDVQGNSYTRTIDVTAWDNLSQGEIAAIVVGALLILLIIVLIILIIIYCISKRKSHDLSYSQRYGSRTPASAERTNF